MVCPAMQHAHTSRQCLVRPTVTCASCASAKKKRDGLIIFYNHWNTGGKRMKRTVGVAAAAPRLTTGVDEKRGSSTQPS